MRFFAAVLALAPLALAGPLAERDAPTVEKDVAAIQTGLTGLNNTLNTFVKGPSSSITALKIASQSTALDKTIQTAANDTANSAPFNQADSTTIATAVVALVPQIQSTLNNLVAHKPVFQQALFGGDASPVVVFELTSLRKDTANFGTQLAQKLSAPYSTLAPQVSAQIDEYFKEAIGNFSSTPSFPGFPGQ